MPFASHNTKMNTKSFFQMLSSNLLGIASLLFFALAFDCLEVVSALDCPGSKTPPLIIKRKRFYVSSTDEYFPIKGIAYYPRPNAGPLSESNSVDFYTDEFEDRWRTDIANMEALGVNAVRLYAVDPSANHDAFMCALQQAGIYVMLGLLADCEDCGIGAWVGVNAEPPLCYTSTVKDRGKFVIRSFSKYDNLMAFSAGNEVSIYADDGAGGPREANVPCQKKFLRDMREYVAGCAFDKDTAVLPRAVPIGVVNWDGNFQSFEQHVYYHCRTDPDDLMENAEWFALNSYRQCDGFATSKDEIVGWPELQATFRSANFPGPVLFGEYGCRERGFPTMDGFEAQRTWYQAEALYTPDYSDVFAGGFVFEYSSEKKVVDVNLQFMADRFNNGVPTSEWPYADFAKLNYGIGYFSPSDCQHDDGNGEGTFTPCEYNKYPEWDGLVEVFANSDAQTVRAQNPGVIPQCPDRFQPLSFYDWPTDDEEDPDSEYCLELQRATDAPTKAPTKAPTASPDSSTGAPTMSTSESNITKSNSTVPPTSIRSSVAPSFVPTSILTVKDIATISPTLSPNLSPALPTNSSTTLSPTSPPTVKPTVKPTMVPTTSPTWPNTLPKTVAPTTSPSVSPILPTTLSTASSPTTPPSVKPTVKPTMLPTASPTWPNTLPKTVSPTPSPSATPTLPNTISPTPSPSAKPFLSPTPSPTAKATELDNAKCSYHFKCFTENLSGDCCPTPDGVMLGCCGDFWDDEKQDSNALESSSTTRGVFLHRFLAFSVMAVVLGCW